MQLPSNKLHQAFSEIDVHEKDNNLEIFYSTMVGLSGEISEGWKTGIAIDSSISMMDAFGKGYKGTIPEDIKKQYQKKGWIQTRNHDGKTVHYYKDHAINDAIKQGFFKSTDNVVKEEARKFSSYIADHLDENGKTDIIYWACGNKGKDIEEYGELDSKSCQIMEFVGPTKNSFGQATFLLPALEYYEMKYRSAERGMFIFITDGELDDLSEIKKFTTNLAQNIESKKRNPFKAILIGIGDKIDEKQMIELDDLDTGTDVDIWDHKIASQMKDILEIFAELVDENVIVASFGTVKDDKGNIIKKFNDGVPAKGSFTLPENCHFFTFEIGNQIIKQPIKLP